MTREQFDNLTINEQLNEIEKQTGLYIYDRKEVEQAVKDWIKTLIDKDYSIIEAIRIVKDEEYIDDYYNFYVVSYGWTADGFRTVNTFDEETEIIDYYYDELEFDE